MQGGQDLLYMACLVHCCYLLFFLTWQHFNWSHCWTQNSVCGAKATSSAAILIGCRNQGRNSHNSSFSLGGSACYQRSTNLIVVQLIGIGSFVLGLFQGLCRPLICTQTKPHTDAYDHNDLEDFVRGSGRGSVCLVNDSHWVNADRVDC